MASRTVAASLWFTGCVLAAGPTPATASATAAPTPAGDFAAAASSTTIPEVPAAAPQGVTSLPVRVLPRRLLDTRAEGDEGGAPPDGAPAEPGNGATGRGPATSGDQRQAGSREGQAGEDDAAAPGPPIAGFGVRIVSPAPDTPVAGKVSIAADVRGDRPSAVQGVDFLVDGRLLFSDVEPPYELMWDSGDPARHLIEVVAYGPGRQVTRDAVETAAAGPGLGASAAFSARVERVEVHVLVEGREPGAAPLGRGAFEVLEGGELQPVVGVERVSNLPVAVGLVVDHSRSMVEVLDRALEAGAAFIEGLMTHPNDKAYLMAFSDVPTLLAGFTNDVERLRDSFELIRGGRYTALYDAVGAASARFEGVDARRAIVLLTDGADHGSDLRLDDAIAAAQRADVAIYPVAVELSPRYFRERWVLERLATATGGKRFGLDRRDDVERIYERIAEDLRSQYRITYTPLRPGGEGEWRDVEVRLTVGDEDEDLEVRARPGYFAR